MRMSLIPPMSGKARAVFVTVLLQVVGVRGTVTVSQVVLEPAPVGGPLFGAAKGWGRDDWIKIIQRPPAFTTRSTGVIRRTLTLDHRAPTHRCAMNGPPARRSGESVSDVLDIGKTQVYLYDGQKIIQTNDGSGNMIRQLIHGTQYIDELVQMRAADKGDLYVHQDANWNIIGLTDQGGNVVERCTYTPYGTPTFNPETSFGDWDGDRDVDATDRAAAEVGGACRGSGPSGACRLLDLDFDDDVDDDDLDLFDDLPQGLARHPGRIASGVDQPFGHQGLVFEPENAWDVGSTVY